MYDYIYIYHVYIICIVYIYYTYHIYYVCMDCRCTMMDRIIQDPMLRHLGDSLILDPSHPLPAKQLPVWTGAELWLVWIPSRITQETMLSDKPSRSETQAERKCSGHQRDSLSSFAKPWMVQRCPKYSCGLVDKRQVKHTDSLGPWHTS